MVKVTKRSDRVRMVLLAQMLHDELQFDGTDLRKIACELACKVIEANKDIEQPELQRDFAASLRGA